MQLAEFTENHDSQELIEKISDEIFRRRMVSPAIFVLEMYKPLYGLMREGANFAAPILMPLLGAKLYRDAFNILQSSSEIEKLIQSLEARMESKSGS